MMRHILTLRDLSGDDIECIFARSQELKERHGQGSREPLLSGRTLALLFEKPSLRTRVSFETAMIQLGGGSLFLGKDVGWGHRESVADFASVISEYVDVIVCRANRHQTVTDLAAHCRVPVLNGLTDLAHPLQALADLFTLRESHAPLEGLKLTYVGDANNVARSLAEACGHLGLRFAIACPPEYRFSRSFVAQLEKRFPDLELTETEDPAEGVRGATAVYTDVWASMGQESERQKRSRAFRPYQVNAPLLSLAERDVCFMHCLPARRGEEVTDEVIDGPSSAVIRQAANRMHVQKGLLVWLLDDS